jgi:hypothetical protein
VGGDTSVKLGNEPAFENAGVLPLEWQTRGFRNHRQIYQWRTKIAMAHKQGIVETHPMMAPEQRINEFDFFARKNRAVIGLC